MHHHTRSAPSFRRRRFPDKTGRAGRLALGLTLGVALTVWLSPAGRVSAGEGGQAAASTPAEPYAHFRPSLQVHRAPGPICIDGDLDDAGWAGAARATGFAEVDPGDQVRPPVESEAWVTYDDQNFYVALVAFDDPKQIRVSWRERDNIFRDDYFGFMLDTYGDHGWGYEFFVNPLGLQGDLRMFRSGDEDISFDVIWNSRGKITDKGYQVEIAIPFASLRYPRRDEQVWRVNFWRDHPRNIRRKYAWSAINRDESCFMCQWGTLTGIAGIPPQRNLEAIANVIGYLNGAPEQTDGRFRYDDPKGEPSLNLRYAVSSTSALEVALNPDFSQIESDAGRINVNTPFAIYYPEKRPFFQEGAELYNTWITAIYTRSIYDPDQAAKFTGRFGSAALAWTFAHDNDSPVILPMEERSFRLQAKKSASNILRLRQSLGEESYLGGILTDRRIQGGGSGTLVGADGSFRFLRHLRFDWQGLINSIEEPDDSLLTRFRPVGDDLLQEINRTTFDYGRHTLRFDGEKLRGHAVFSQLQRNGRTWNGSLQFQEYHPNFRADNGFVTRADWRVVEAWSGFEFHPNGRWLLSVTPSADIARVWDYSGRFQDEWLVPELSTSWVHQTQIELKGVWSRECFRETLFPGIRRVTVAASTRFGERVGLALELTRGRTIYRAFGTDPVLGRSLFLDLSGSIKILDRLALSPEITYERMKTPDGQALLYDLYVLRNRLDLQFSREASLRLINEYDKAEHSLTVEPLLTYRINPFSVFYLGLSDLYSVDLPEEAEKSLLDVPAPHFVSSAEEAPLRTRSRLESRQVFAKLQYLFRL